MRTPACRRTLTTAALLVLASCGRSPREALAEVRPVPPPPAPAPIQGGGFADVTASAGIDTVHRLPGEELTNIVDSLGGGAAFTDLDGDGWLDLLLLSGARSPMPGADPSRHGGLHLYRNRGDGTFEDVTRLAGLPPDGTGVALAVADVDGDKDRDVYLVDRGPNRLFLNRGDATFEDCTRAAGLGDDRFGAGAVFFDADADGDLDLYLANYLEFDPHESAYYAPTGFPGPLAYEAQADAFFRNLGGGRFEDASEESGIGALLGRGMSLAADDFDDDGDVDLFVANDATENFLLLGDGQGGFVEGGLRSGLALGGNGERTAAMAADVGDVDGDGDLDLAVSDIAFGALYQRVRPGRFQDRSMVSGVGLACGQYVSWGQNLLDYDCDGDLDLFVANGGLHHLVGWEDLLLENDGSGHFEDVSARAGPHFTRRMVGRSSIVGDYDNDGDLDLLVTHLQDSPVLLRNDRATEGSWITLDLVGTRQRDPFGALVEVEAGGRRRVARLRCPTGYLGQSDPRLHFGLGPGVERVDRITITWPDGHVQELGTVPARRIHRIARSTP